LSTFFLYLVPVKSYDGFYVAKSHALKGGGGGEGRWGAMVTTEAQDFMFPNIIFSCLIH